jgi:hypothetical protein
LLRILNFIKIIIKKSDLSIALSFPMAIGLTATETLKIKAAKLHSKVAAAE